MIWLDYKGEWSGVTSVQSLKQPIPGCHNNPRLDDTKRADAGNISPKRAARFGSLPALSNSHLVLNGGDNQIRLKARESAKSRAAAPRSPRTAERDQSLRRSFTSTRSACIKGNLHRPMDLAANCRGYRHPQAAVAMRLWRMFCLCQ
jgi:hypothetical protein